MADERLESLQSTRLVASSDDESRRPYLHAGRTHADQRLKLSNAARKCDRLHCHLVEGFPETRDRKARMGRHRNNHPWARLGRIIGRQFINKREDRRGPRLGQ